MHSTNCINDKYLGSGTALRASVKQYGEDAHSKEIIEFCASKEALIARERSIITPELLRNPLCMNIRIGGIGGLQGLSEESRKRFQEAGTIAVRRLQLETHYLQKAFAKKLEDPIWKGKWQERVKEGLLKNGYSWEDFTRKGREKALSECSKKKRKDSLRAIQHQQGCRNSQFGTIWITNGIISKKSPRNKIVPEGFWKGRCIKRRDR
jgi:hypothetical protein